MAGAITLLAASAASALPPVNDDFAQAEVLSGASVRATASNLDASKQAGEPDHGGDPGGHSLWWEWTAPITDIFVIDTAGSDFDTLLAVYTGSQVDALTPVAANDDASGGTKSRVVLEASAGTTYRISVDGFEGRAGSITLRLSKGLIRVPADIATIQSAIDAAFEGETVLVAPGNYFGSIDFLGKGITLASEAGPGVTTISGDPGGTHSSKLPTVRFVNNEPDDAVLQGFTLRRPMDGGFHYQVEMRWSSPVLLDNRVVGSPLHEAILAVFGAPSILDNVIEGSANTGLRVNSSSALVARNNIIGNEFIGISLRVDDNFAPTIVDNLIANNGAGVDISNFGMGDALIVQNVIVGNGSYAGGRGINWRVRVQESRSKLLNNTIARNLSQYGFGNQILAEGFDADTKIVNSVIDSTAPVDAVHCTSDLDPTPPMFSFNDVFASAGVPYSDDCSDPTGLDGNISADPLFVDPASGDYRIGPDSPAIDVGDSADPDLPAFDFDGLPRVTDGDATLGAAVDMGAFEHRPGGVFALASRQFEATESDGTAAITIRRLGGSAGAASVDYRLAGVTAGDGDDYTAASGTLEFDDGDATPRKIDVPLVDDGPGEGPEVFRVILENASGAALGRDHKADVVIDELLPNLGVTTAPSTDVVGTGEVFTLTVVVENAGEGRASDTTLSIGFDRVVQVSSATASAGSCSGSGPVVCELGTLTGEHEGGSDPVTVQVTLSVPDVGTLSIDAAATAFETDAVPADNSHAASLSVEPGYAAQDFFPVVPGMAWRYRTDSGKSVSAKVSSKQVKVNGIRTTPMTFSDGDAWYFTSDDLGIGIHRNRDRFRVPGVGTFRVTSTLQPPIQLLDGITRVGKVVEGSGTLRISVPGVGGGTLEYSARSEVVGFEDVTVPAGTFSALKVSLTLDISGRVQGVQINETETDIFWLVNHLGTVKHEGFVGGGLEASNELVSDTVDLDEDGVYAFADNCRIHANPLQRDSDGDGVGDACDEAPYPVAQDTDLDGMPDNTDDDDDDDGLGDGYEFAHGFDPLDLTDAVVDADGDGYTTLEEHDAGSDPLTKGSIPPPVLLAPTAGGTLPGHAVTFRWDNRGSVSRWALRVGTTPGGREILSKSLGRSVSEHVVSRLPTLGGTVYVRLSATSGGTTQSVDYEFDAAAFPLPTVTPTGDSLAGSEVTFTLEPDAHDLTGWNVEVFEPASSGRDRRIFRRTLRGTEEQVTVGGLPTFGELVVLRLGYRLSGRAWQYRSFEYTASSPGVPEFLTPDPASGALPLNNAAGTGVEFTWTANGQPVNRWRLYVGTTRGGRELYRSPNLRGDILSRDTRRVFPDSSVYVRLFYRVGKVQRFVDYQYNPQADTLRALYPVAEELGPIVPVKNDGLDVFGASGRLCNGKEKGGHEACLQAGLMKVMTLPASVTSCATVAVEDLLDVFEWECRETVPVEVVSVGLKGAWTDLIDVSMPGEPAFKSNQVIVEDGGVEVARSALEPWWATPMVVLPGDGLMRDSDTVYVVEDANPAVNLLMDRAKRSLVLVSPDVGDAVSGAGLGGGAVVKLTRSPFSVVQGDYVAAGESTVVLVDRSPFAIVTDVEAEGAQDFVAGRRTTPGTGIRVSRSNNVIVLRVKATENQTTGIALDRSRGVWVMESAALANGTGVDIDRASGNGLFDVHVRHNALAGIVVERSSDNRLEQLVVSNNGTGLPETGGHGIEVIHSSSRRNVIGFVQAFNNAGDGIFVNRGRNTLIYNVTSFNHPGAGVALDRAFDTTMVSSLLLNNGDFGLGLIGGTQRTQVEDLVSVHNTVGVYLSGRSRRNVFAGLMKLGGNGANCEVEAGSGDLIDDTCGATGASTHTLVTGISAGATLVGKRTESGSTALFSDLVDEPGLLEDLGAGEGTYTSRGFGRDGGTFPSDDHRGPCVSGETCRIWDGALAAGDTGDAGGPVAAQVLAIPGAEDVVRHRFRSFETFLRHASEIIFDGVGDDDGACESGEDCSLDLNIGAFQGEEGDWIADEEIGFDLTLPARNKPPRVEDVGLDARIDTVVVPLP